MHKPSTIKDFTAHSTDAAVAAGATSTFALFDCRPYGDRYAIVRVTSAKAFTLNVWAGPAEATAVTGCALRYTAAGEGLTANAGKDFFIPIAGAAKIAPVVTNNDAAAASAITVKVLTFNP